MCVERGRRSGLFLGYFSSRVEHLACAGIPVVGNSRLLAFVIKATSSYSEWSSCEARVINSRHVGRLTDCFSINKPSRVIFPFTGYTLHHQIRHTTFAVLCLLAQR